MSVSKSDEMLAYFNRNSEIEQGIRTILAILVERRETDLEAIRAFVERVEKRLPSYDSGRGAEAWLKAYHLAVRDELAAMEKEHVEHRAE